MLSRSALTDGSSVVGVVLLEASGTAFDIIGQAKEEARREAQERAPVLSTLGTSKG